MVKVRGKGENRVEALRLADAFRARVIDATHRELRVRDHRRERQDRAASSSLMLPLGLVEVSRTGIVAIGRGPEGDVTTLEVLLGAGVVRLRDGLHAGSQ